MGSNGAGERAARPAGALLHPASLAALAVLAINDQLLKYAWPGPVTGKLSDVAGLVLAPLVLQAAWEVWRWLRGGWSGPSPRAALVAIAATAALFAAIQLWPPAVEVWRWGLGYVQYSLRALAAIAGWGAAGQPRPVAATPDAEDLLALPALAISWWIAWRRTRPAGPAPAAGGRPD